MSTKGISISDVKIVDLGPGGGDIEILKSAVNTSGTGTSVSQMRGHNIVEVPLPKKQNIQEFEPGKLQDSKGLRYSEVKRKFVVDSDRKNARFQLSALTKGPLSVAAEEEQRIESEVERRLNLKLSEIHEQVRAKASREGFAAGQKAGRAEILSQSRPMLQSLEKVIKNLENMRQEIFKANEEYLIRMVYRLAKFVILRELKDDKEYLTRLVSQIIEQTGTRENIKVFVGPSEESTVQTLKEELAKTLGQLKNIHVEIDHNIESAGCRVETDFSEVDATLEVQINNIARTLSASS